MNIEKIPLSYRGKYIQGYRCGRGTDAILLLHGSGTDNALLSWKEVMERLGKRTVVYAVDLPGYGNSEPLEQIPEEGFYPYYHHCLEAIVDQLKLDRFALVGLSMGGAIAIRYALEHPEQVCGLVPVDSWGLSEKAPTHLLSNWVIHRTSWLRKMCAKLAQSPSMTKMFIQSVCFGRKNTTTNELVAEIQQLLGRESVVDSIEFFQKSSITPKGAIPYFGEELSRLKMPVLLIHGKKDPLVPRAHAERAARIIRNSRLHIMPTCKHWSCKEQPELFYQALWAFVKRDCLFSYKNMLPVQPVRAEEGIPQTSAETVENPLRKNLKNRWEKRRKARTKLRLSSGNPVKKSVRRKQAILAKNR